MAGQYIDYINISTVSIDEDWLFEIWRISKKKKTMEFLGFQSSKLCNLAHSLPSLLQTKNNKRTKKKSAKSNKKI